MKRPTDDLTAPEAVERFHASEFSADMIPASRGDYVRYEDYAALSAALEAEKARNEKLEVDMANFAEANHRQANCIHFTAQNLGPEYSATIDGLPKAARHVAARAEALDAKLKDAVNVMQAWKTAGTDQDYYQAVQKRNAFLASLEGDKPDE